MIYYRRIKILFIKNIPLILCFSISFLIYLFFLQINFLTPLYGEDLALSIPLSKQSIFYYDKIILIFQKIVNQSSNWNARIGEQIAIIFASNNKLIFNILNSLLTFAYFGLIYIVSLGKIPRINWKFFLYISIIPLLFINLPIIGDIFFWLTGSSNYLWSSFLQLIIFLPFRLLISGFDIFNNKRIGFKMFFLLLSFLAGMTNENSVLSLIVLVVFTFISFGINKKKLIGIKWYVLNFIFLIFGYIFLLTSPSTKLRRNYYLNQINIDLSDINSIIHKFSSLFENFLKNSISLLEFTLVLVIIYFLLMKIIPGIISKESSERLLLSFLFLCISFTSLLPLFFAYFESRSLLLIWVFLINFIIVLHQEILNNNKIIGILLIIPFAILGLLKMQNIYNCYVDFNSLAVSRQMTIESNISSGNKEINVNRIPNICPNIFSNREEWTIHFKHDEVYYGVKEINIIN